MSESPQAKGSSVGRLLRPREQVHTDLLQIGNALTNLKERTEQTLRPLLNRLNKASGHGNRNLLRALGGPDPAQPYEDRAVQSLEIAEDELNGLQERFQLVVEVSLTGKVLNDVTKRLDPPGVRVSIIGGGPDFDHRDFQRETKSLSDTIRWLTMRLEYCDDPA